jgi:resuscitation-promoting factor RpfA
MTKKIPLSRPATCAIAAFLAMSSPSAFAQDTTAPVAPPTAPTVMVPPVAPTTAPAPAPVTSAPVIAPAPEPVIRVPVDIAPAPAPVAKATPQAAPKAPARPAATAARTAAPTPVASAPFAGAPGETFAAETTAMPLPEETVAPVAPVVDPAATPAADSASTGSGFPWELAGGAAALLIVGGAALAFTRRRRIREDENWAESTIVYDEVPVVAPVAPHVVREPQPAPAQPAYALNEEHIVVPPAPVQRSTPAFAAAPSGSMGRHEAMALVGPTADNPFLTLKKRLKRARFYDRKERHEYEGLMDQPQVARQPVSAWEIANRPEPALAKKTTRRPDQAPLFPGRLRPGYAGS